MWYLASGLGGIGRWVLIMFTLIYGDEVALTESNLRNKSSEIGMFIQLVIYSKNTFKAIGSVGMKSTTQYMDCIYDERVVEEWL